MVIDDYSNCQEDILDRLFKVVGEKNSKLIHVKKGNVLDLEFIEKVFQEQKDEGSPI